MRQRMNSHTNVQYWKIRLPKVKKPGGIISVDAQYSPMNGLWRPHIASSPMIRHPKYGKVIFISSKSKAMMHQQWFTYRLDEEMYRISYGYNVKGLKEAPRHRIDNFILHDDYHRKRLENDLALILVVGLIAINGKNVQSIHLSTKKVEPGTMVLMCKFRFRSQFITQWITQREPFRLLNHHSSAGWGTSIYTMEPNHKLQALWLKTISKTDCLKYVPELPPKKFCTFNSDRNAEGTWKVSDLVST